jgi:hypothetical protein
MIPYVRPELIDGLHPFLREAHRRSLRVFVDPRIVRDDATAQSGVAQTFITLLKHVSPSQWVDLYTVDDAEVISELNIERLKLDTEDDVVRVIRASAESVRTQGVGWESTLTRRAQSASARSKTSADEWHDALVVLAVARTIKADILVTDRSATLLGRDSALGSTEFIVTRAEAISLLGLLFREHEEWADLLPSDAQSPPFEWLARRTAVLAMLDTDAVGHLRVVTHSSTATGGVPTSRADSLVKRVTTAVSIRDVIAAEAMKPPSPARAERVAVHLEWLALTISGAFDSLALTVNDHLGTDASEKRFVSWTEKEWREKVAEKHRDLIRTVQDRSIVTYLTLCKYLRDTIHDIGPCEFTGQFSRSHGKTLFVSMPGTVASHCKKFAEGLAGTSLGLIDAFGGTSFDPVTLADRLVDIGIEKLNTLLTAMPWEAFGSRTESLPPRGTHPMYSAQSGEFVKMCFGLGAERRRSAALPRRR